MTEAIMYRSGENTLHDVRSSRTGFIWQTVHERESKIVASNKYQKLDGGSWSNPFKDGRLWSYNIPGFEFGETRPSIPGMSVGVWVIQYWIPVIPLTLLSAYLLLSKPRPAKTPEPRLPEEPDHA